MVVCSNDQVALCQAALVFAVIRWILSSALTFLTTFLDIFSSSSDSSMQASRCSSSSSANLRMVRESLFLTTLGKLQHPDSHGDASCAVCLNQLRKNSQVWELSNCCHVFHKHCLEKWLCYDNRLTCPLCRASLVTLSSSLVPREEAPSWAVEQMLYFFGDDLLPQTL